MPPSASDACRGAFTLLELLAAMALLAVLVAGAVGIINAVANNTTSSNESAGAAARARAVFDRLDQDLLHRLKRPDVPAVRWNGGRADTPQASSPVIISLVAEAPGAAESGGGERAEGSPAVIQYRLVSDAPSSGDGVGAVPALQRAAEAMLAADFKPFSRMATALGLGPSGSKPTAPETGPDEFVTFCPGVIALAVGSLGADGSYLAPSGGELKDGQNAVVAVAVVDDGALIKATPEQVGALIRAVPVPVAGTALPLEQWTGLRDGGVPAGVPEFLWNSLRFYQRLIPLS